MKKLLALAPVILGLVIYYNMNKQNEAPLTSPDISEAPALQEAPSEAPLQLSEEKVVMPPETQGPPQPRVRIEDKAFSRYEILKEKVLRTPKEEKELSQILSDSRMALRLKPLFDLGADQSQQFNAIDFIFEQEQISGATKSLLKSVLSDPRIENSSLPLPQRQELAGISAELAYRWMAKDPKVKPEIEQSLSGPVGKKILARVQEQFEKNETESRIVNGDDPGQL